MKKVFIPCVLLSVVMLSSVVCAQVTDPRVADVVKAGNSASAWAWGIPLGPQGLGNW